MSTELFEVMNGLMPILQKYSEVTPKFLNIKIEKYNEGTIIKIQSDVTEVGEILAEILSSFSGVNPDCKVDVKVEDYKNV